jgi:hypothetical protein
VVFLREIVGLDEPKAFFRLRDLALGLERPPVRQPVNTARRASVHKIFRRWRTSSSPKDTPVRSHADPLHTRSRCWAIGVINSHEKFLLGLDLRVEFFVLMFPVPAPHSPRRGKHLECEHGEGTPKKFTDKELADGSKQMCALIFP